MKRPIPKIIKNTCRFIHFHVIRNMWIVHCQALYHIPWLLTLVLKKMYIHHIQWLMFMSNVVSICFLFKNSSLYNPFSEISFLCFHLHISFGIVLMQLSGDAKPSWLMFYTNPVIILPLGWQFRLWSFKLWVLNEQVQRKRLYFFNCNDKHTRKIWKFALSTSSLLLINKNILKQTKTHSLSV